MEGSVIQVPQKKDRQMLSKLFLYLVKAFLGVPRTLTDTQCGFKLYKGGIARELFGGLETRGFLFEIEIILAALRKNYRIGEFPVEWRCDRDSRISVSSTLGRVLSEAVHLKMKRY
jgi:dolichyl-phosphate beta-glucosyltransferase